VVYDLVRSILIIQSTHFIKSYSLTKGFLSKFTLLCYWTVYLFRKISNITLKIYYIYLDLDVNKYNEYKRLICQPWIRFPLVREY